MTIHAQEPVFTLRLRQEGTSWALVDAAGQTRASSPSRELLTDCVPEIADALLQSAQMDSRLAQAGSVISGSVTWAVRA